MIVHDPENELKFLAMEPSKTWQEKRGTWPCYFKVKATVYQMCLCKNTFITREKLLPTKIPRHLCLWGLCDINVFPVSETELTSQTGWRVKRGINSLCVMIPGKGKENKLTHYTGALNWRSHYPLHNLQHLPVNDTGNTELDLSPIVNNNLITGYTLTRSTHSKRSYLHILPSLRVVSFVAARAGVTQAPRLRTAAMDTLRKA